jgi:hypothetical protein
MAEDQLVEGVAPNPPSRRTLLIVTLGGFLAAAVIAVLFVLPVEMGIDPLGFGRLTGLNRLAGPKTVSAQVPPAAAGAAPITAARYYATPYRTDEIDIPLDTPDKRAANSELEYKVRMKPGASLVYAWTVTGLSVPEEFYFDFHGETPAGPANPQAKVVEYLQTTGLKSSGSLIAPIEGVHGWYLQNQSASPVVVHLKLAGFYELVPPGEYGNEAGIEPKPSKAR